MATTNDSEQKLELVYPCNWSYRLICSKEHTMEVIAKELLDNRPFTLVASNESKSGNYKSFNLELLVHSDEDRHALFDIFKKHHQIKMVL